jgi:hypothetical protein
MPPKQIWVLWFTATAYVTYITPIWFNIIMLIGFLSVIRYDNSNKVIFEKEDPRV